MKMRRHVLVVPLTFTFPTISFRPDLTVAVAPNPSISVRNKCAAPDPFIARHFVKQKYRFIQLRQLPPIYVYAQPRHTMPTPCTQAAFGCFIVETITCRWVMGGVHTFSPVACCIACAAMCRVDETDAIEPPMMSWCQTIRRNAASIIGAAAISLASCSFTTSQMVVFFSELPIWNP